MAVLAQEIDRVALWGTGANNMPVGIAHTTSVGTPITGTGLPTWSNLVALESAVVLANADQGSLAYIIDPRSRGVFKSTPRIGTAYPSYLWGDIRGAEVNSYPCFVSGQASTTTSVGNAFFGDWSSLVIGTWGTAGVDIIADPYTVPGALRITELSDVDIAVRHPESFAVFLGYSLS
jgi:hypothetical protein